MTTHALPEERHAAIMRQLQDHGRVLAIELARRFSTSEDTIRRDLRDLAAAGLCRRVYGGALRVSSASAPLHIRSAEGSEAKQALAEVAVTILGAGQTLFIDTGSTNLHIAEALPEGRRLTIVTNAPAVAACVAQRRCGDLIVIGGRVDHETGGSFGARALRDLGEMQFDLAFLGVCAISRAGVAVFDPEEAAFKRAVVSVSGETVVAATNGKLSTTAPFRFANLDDIATLVVEWNAPEPVLASLDLSPGRIRRSAPAAKAKAQ